MYDMFKRLCKEKGITIKKATKEIGLSRTTVFAWQNHNPTSETVKKVSDYFDVSTDYLLTGKEKAAAQGDGIDEQIISLVAQLPEHQKKALVEYLKAIVNN